MLVVAGPRRIRRWQLRQLHVEHHLLLPAAGEGLGARPERGRRQPRSIRSRSSSFRSSITIGAGATLNLPLAGWIWVPFILARDVRRLPLHGQPVVSEGRLRGIGRRAPRTAPLAPRAAVHRHLRLVHRLRRASSPSSSPTSSPTSRPSPWARQSISLAFLGALVGSLARPFGGRLADRFGGARITMTAFAVMALGAHRVVLVDPAARQLLDLPRLLPAPVRRHRRRQRLDVPHDPERLRGAAGATRTTESGDVGTQRKAAAALGLISAIGAYGGFVDPADPRALARLDRQLRGRVHRLHRRVRRAVRGHLPRLLPPWLAPLAAPPHLSRRTTHACAARRGQCTDTHCPYCALQCAMTLTPAVGGRTRSLPGSRSTSPGGTSRRTAAASARRAGRRPSSSRAAIASRPPRSASADGALVEAELGCGPRPRRRHGCARSAPSTGRTRSASSAAADSRTRRPTSSASSPGSPSAPAASTTTAGSACRRPRRRATARSASTAGCRSPSSDLDARRDRPAARHQRRRDDAARSSAISPVLRPPVASSWSIRAASATARLTEDGAGIHVQPDAGNGSGRCSSASPTSSSPRGSPTRPTWPSARRGSTGCAAA